MSDPLLAEVVQQSYPVGPAFAQAYLDYWFRAGDFKSESLEEILALPSPWPMWFEYALGTNARGKRLREVVLPLAGATAGRYLDVGCGFGGCLVAFSEAGYEVAGIEIDPTRRVLAEANCADHGLSEVVHDADILDPRLPERLGRFDIITCIDVIEHVQDAATALRHLADLLNPGGLLALEIPNKDSLRFVAEDGHYALFGITLLERADAMGYYQALFTAPYSVGEYHAQEWYVQALDALGCSSSIRPSPIGKTASLRDLGWLTWATVRSCLRRRSSRLPPWVDAQLRLQYSRYLRGLAADVRDLILWRTTRDAFRRRYLADFWLLLATKPLAP